MNLRTLHLYVPHRSVARTLMMLYPSRASFSLWTALGTVVILTYVIGCSHAVVYSQSDNANCSEVCRESYNACYNSPFTYTCPRGCLEPNSSIKWPPVKTAAWYVVADFFPLLFVIPIILLFNINLAFGPGHCLVFFYQILGCYVLYYGVYNPYLGNPVNPIYSGILNIFGFMVFHNPVLEAVAITSSSGPNPTPNPYSFPMLILSYIKVVLAILYFVSILFLVSRSQFPFEHGSISWSKLRRALRRFRGKHAYEGSVLVGTTSVLILIFGYVVEISFNLLSMGGNNECCCGSYNYMPQYAYVNPYHRAIAGYSQSIGINIATDFIGYGNPYIAIPVISLLLLLFSSLALIYYPAIQNVFYYVCKCNCPRLTKLDPVIDVLQGGYKLRLRFFAGIYLLYRILIWSIWAFVSDPSVRQFTLTCVITTILLVHSIFQPFQQKRHNYFESLNLLAIILASFGSNALVVKDKVDITKSILNITFLIFPGILVIFYYIYKLVRCTCTRRCCPPNEPSPCSRWWSSINYYDQLQEQD